MNKYTVTGWAFLAMAFIGDSSYEGLRGDINFYGCAIICAIFVVASWVVEDLKK